MKTYGTDFNIYDIKPKNTKVSDKYSANLYKYFKKNPNSRVFKPKDKNNGSPTKIVFGNIVHDKIICSLMSNILRYGFPYILYLKADEYEDITKTFMDEYIRSGRCVWDKAHNGWLQGSKDRFTYTNENERVCNWCGEVQRKKEVMKIDYEWDNLHEINIYGENKIKSKYPFKVFSISKDGSDNEVEVFEGAFETLDKAKEYRPDHNDYHKLLIEVEEDNHV